jgi:uncharacterized protein (TIGR00251 family)
MTLLRVKVTPKARSNSIVGWEEDRLKVRLRANPEKGEANEMLIEFLAELLGVRRSAIHLIRGHTSRLKDLEIDGMDLVKIKEILPLCGK